jgi:predicted Zn-dependent peptidase
MSDILKLLRTDAEDFYRKTYRPDQGVLAIVGGVEAKEVLPLLEKTLGAVPNPPVAPLKKEWSKEPPQEGEKAVHATFDADPMAMVGWHMPNFPHPDAVALDVLSSVMTSGNTSRLIKKLVFEKKIVTSVSAETGYPGDRSPCLFVMEFTPASKITTDAALQAIDAEIADIQKNGVAQEELDRAKRGVESGFLWGKVSAAGLAQDLAYNQAVHGDWRYLTKYLEMVRKLTVKDLQAAAQKYLVAKNRTVAYLERPAK